MKKMTRKRYIKLLMRFGISRNVAINTAMDARRLNIPYAKCLEIKDGKPIFRHTNIHIYTEYNAWADMKENKDNPNYHMEIPQCRKFYRCISMCNSEISWKELKFHIEELKKEIKNRGENPMNYFEHFQSSIEWYVKDRTAGLFDVKKFIGEY